jgi:hypothetical protein
VLVATLPNVVKACASLLQAMRRKPSGPTKAGLDGAPRDIGLTTRAAVVVLVGVAVGTLVGMTSSVGAGLVAGIAAAAAVNGLIRPGS